MRLWGGRMNWDFILVCHEGSETDLSGAHDLRFFEIARVLVRFDRVARFHLDELGASDFYLYINPPRA
jgi:hypothetical protein